MDFFYNKKQEIPFFKIKNRLNSAIIHIYQLKKNKRGSNWILVKKCDKMRYHYVITIKSDVWV